MSKNWFMKFVKNWGSKLPSVPRAIVLAVFCVASLTVFGVGCEVPLRWEGSITPTSTGIGVPTTAQWESIEPGVERLDAKVSAAGAAARVVLWRFSTEADWTWSLATSTEPQSVSQWVDDPQTDVIFAVNAGYFHADGFPSGWVSLDGLRWGKRAFDEGRSGIVSLGAKPTVLLGTTPTSTVRVDAFQSYPFLIKAGKQAFPKETGQYARRTFVAVDAEGRWYVGVVPTEPVTLFQLVGLLQSLPVNWERVLNLDGGPSTGLVTALGGREERFDSFAPVAYAIVAKRRL